MIDGVYSSNARSHECGVDNVVSGSQRTRVGGGRLGPGSTSPSFDGNRRHTLRRLGQQVEVTDGFQIQQDTRDIGFARNNGGNLLRADIGFDSDFNEVRILTPESEVIVDKAPKETIAEIVLDNIAQAVRARRGETPLPA